MGSYISNGLHPKYLASAPWEILAIQSFVLKSAGKIEERRALVPPRKLTVSAAMKMSANSSKDVQDQTHCYMTQNLLGEAVSQQL